MGITHHETRALVELYNEVGPLGRVITLGRQEVFVQPNYSKTLLGTFRTPPTLSALRAACESRYAEDFFRLLGATEVVSIDYSDYQGAAITHDMNSAVPTYLHRSFDLVYDGGTLEHIYNFPQAIQNCVDMLKCSGLYIGATPANNWIGHGFYQFSPELFFRLFSPERGFRMERMLAFEYEPGGSRFEVQDPRKLGRRAELPATRSQILLFVVARKLVEESSRDVPFPQQSDYSLEWQANRQNTGQNQSGKAKMRRRLVAYLEKSFPALLDAVRNVRRRLFVRKANRRGMCLDPQAFKKVP